MKYWILLPLCLFVHNAFGDDAVLALGEPHDVDMDATILQASVEMIRTAEKNDALQGAVLLVARGGKIVVHEAIGWQDRQARIRMKKDTMFRMASNTKQVVATGIAILAEDGRLGYDDFARDHLASFDNYRSGDIRIHHLLTHTSGFRIEPVFFKPLLEKSAAHPDAPNLQIEVARFGEFGATEPVGTSYEYSNPGYNTLGAIIEVASGQPLEAFLKQRIYEPLGMTDSYHLETREVLGDKLDRMSVVYKREEEDWVEHWKPGDPPQYPFVRASGGMISTALDFARFCQMFLNEGIYDGKRILTEDAVQTMMLPRAETGATVDGRPVPGDHYGYGWHVSGEGVLWHTGADGTVAWVDPDNELIVLFLGQSDKTRPLAWRFFRLVELAINH